MSDLSEYDLYNNLTEEGLLEASNGRWGDPEEDDTPDDTSTDTPSTDDSSDSDSLDRPNTQEPPSVSTPQEIDGVPYSRIQELIEFDRRLAADKALQEHLLRFNQQPEPQSQLVPELDLDDPAIAYLYQQNQQTTAQLAELQKIIAANTVAIQDRQFADVKAVTTRAKANFQKTHQLTDEELEEISSIAGRSQVVNILSSGVDPITGATFDGSNPYLVVERALEISLPNSPLYNSRANKKVNDERKRKLSAVAGKGSAPAKSINPRDMTEAERRKAMIAEIAGLQE